MYAVAVGAGHVIAIGENKIQESSEAANKRAKSSETTSIPKEKTKKPVIENIFNAKKKESKSKKSTLESADHYLKIKYYGFSKIYSCLI